MFLDLARSLRFTLAGMLLCGVLYPTFIYGVGRVALPFQAGGSLVRRPDGSAIGSRLLAQGFTKPEYFHSRPSAVGHNAASTGGSNLGPTNPDHLTAVATRVAGVRALEGVPTGPIPADAVTASGSGVDPHISPAYAALQVARVSRARHLTAERVRALVASATEGRFLGLLGRPRVNVLILNLQLDRERSAGVTSGPAVENRQ
jgi:K+-transporting ATPase ATPase C chain